jgi:hypothetical protein
MTPRQLGFGFFQLAGRRVLTLGAIASGLLFVDFAAVGEIAAPPAHRQRTSRGSPRWRAGKPRTRGGLPCGVVRGADQCARTTHLGEPESDSLQLCDHRRIAPLAPSMGAFALIAGIVMAEWSQLILLLPPLARTGRTQAVPRGDAGAPARTRRGDGPCDAARAGGWAEHGRGSLLRGSVGVMERSRHCRMQIDCYICRLD